MCLAIYPIELNRIFFSNFFFKFSFETTLYYNEIVFEIFSFLTRFVVFDHRGVCLGGSSFVLLYLFNLYAKLSMQSMKAHTENRKTFYERKQWRCWHLIKVRNSFDCLSLFHSRTKKDCIIRFQDFKRIRTIWISFKFHSTSRPHQRDIDRTREWKVSFK